MGVVIRNVDTHRCEDVNVYLDDGTCIRDSFIEGHSTTVETPFEDSRLVDVLFEITKSKEEEGLVSGWANVAVNADGSLPLDWQDDVILPETLEKAAINFMLEYRESGVMHKGDAQGIVVESIVFTKEKQQAIGIPEGTIPEGWFITVKVTNPEVFEKVKDGKYKMFSIQGNCKRRKL